jgi:predicted RNase H-like HicB family nuclease
MTNTQGAQPVRSEARGPHWVAWIPDAGGKPVNSVVLVGETREEAEDRARKWAELEGR